jgi:hypothetical protein
MNNYKQNTAQETQNVLKYLRAKATGRITPAGRSYLEIYLTEWQVSRWLMFLEGA